MLRIGTLDQLLTLLTPTTSAPGGEVTVAYAAAGQLWASVRVKSEEHVQQGGTVTVRTFTIRAHYRADITEKHRLQWGDRILSITSIGDPEQTRIEMLLTAVEVV
jgi:SPP1 family predicted phage head-tail adaptor